MHSATPWPVQDIKISLDDLYERKHVANLRIKSLFDSIVTRIYKHIKRHVKYSSGTTTFYTVRPDWGTPQFSEEECIQYITAQLVEDGFKITYLFPMTFQISWEHFVPKYVRDEFKRKTGMEMDAFGEVVNFVTQGEEEARQRGNQTSKAGGDNARMDESRKTFFQNIHNFRPSGKMVYDSYILQKLDTQLNETKTTSSK